MGIVCVPSFLGDVWSYGYISGDAGINLPRRITFHFLVQVKLEFACPMAGPLGWIGGDVLYQYSGSGLALTICTVCGI